MIEKNISFEAVPKNSQRWSWGDVGQQTVPGVVSNPTTGNARSPTVDSRDVGSLAASARMTTTGDGGGWNRRRAGCSRKDTVARLATLLGAR